MPLFNYKTVSIRIYQRTRTVLEGITGLSLFIYKKIPVVNKSLHITTLSTVEPRYNAVVTSDHALREAR